MARFSPEERTQIWERLATGTQWFALESNTSAYLMVFLQVEERKLLLALNPS